MREEEGAGPASPAAPTAAGLTEVCAWCGGSWPAPDGDGPAPCPGCGRRCTLQVPADWPARGLVRHVVLPDGAPLLLRPLVPADRAEVEAGFAALSEASRRSRFLTAPEHLAEDDVTFLTELDYRDRFAFVAGVPSEGGPPVGVGLARYDRDRDDPTAAEFAVTVVDAQQRRGIGRALTLALAEVAATNGVDRFVGYVRWENDQVIQALQARGARVAASEPGVARVEVDLPQPDQDDGRVLREVLSLLAGHLRLVLCRLGLAER